MGGGIEFGVDHIASDVQGWALALRGRGKDREGGAGEGDKSERAWAKSAHLRGAKAFGVSSHSIDHPLSFFVDWK
jgi:hypothetical protein